MERRDELIVVEPVIEHDQDHHERLEDIDIEELYYWSIRLQIKDIVIIRNCKTPLESIYYYEFQDKTAWKKIIEELLQNALIDPEVKMYACLDDLYNHWKLNFHHLLETYHD